MSVRTERDFEQFLQNVLDTQDEDVDARVSTFEDVGMLTRNRGLVVRLQNGAEFQVTIVQSQEAEGGAAAKVGVLDQNEWLAKAITYLKLNGGAPWHTT